MFFEKNLNEAALRVLDIDGNFFSKNFDFSPFFPFIAHCENAFDLFLHFHMQHNLPTNIVCLSDCQRIFPPKNNPPLKVSSAIESAISKKLPR